MKKHYINLVRSAALLSMAGSLMGNQSCQSAVATRTLARRVMIQSFTAPPITLPPSLNNASFNFGAVANLQLGTVLNQTGTFSTASMDPTQQFDPASLNNEINNDFNQCSSFATQSVVINSITPASVSASGVQEVNSYTNSCVINQPQGLINGGITDFSLIGGGGLSLSLANIAVLPSISFSFSDYELDLNMMAYKPMDIGHNAFVSTLTSSNGYSGSLSATISFDGLTLGPSGYFTTPLSNVVSDGLTSAVNELASNWTAQDPWYANVYQDCGSYVYINGSSDLKLEVGDILAIKNVTYMWTGAVCDSQWVGDVPDATPVSYVQITSLGDNISQATILKGNTAYPQVNNTIYAGARAYMYQTAEQVQALQQQATGTTGVCQLPVGACGAPASN